MSDAIAMLKDALSGHPTEYAFLSTFDQQLAAKAQSVVQRAVNEFGNAEELVDRSFLRKAFFDAVDRKNLWASDAPGTTWSAKPTLYYPFERVERGSRPQPLLMTVPSFTTTNTVVVMLAFRDVNFQGYGELSTADFFQVSEIFPSAQAAEDFARELSGSLKFLTLTLPAQVARHAQRGEGTTTAGQATVDF